MKPPKIIWKNNILVIQARRLRYNSMEREQSPLYLPNTLAALELCIPKILSNMYDIICMECEF
jgi:hypothetical protein